MALFLFVKAILNNEPIKVFNNGEMKRDFTYIDDIIESITRIINKIPSPDQKFDYLNPQNSSSWCPYKIFNIGNSNTINLMQYIECIEKTLGKKANKIFLPMQPGDVEATYADTSLIESWINFKPSTKIEKGIKEFVKWYLNYYG